MCGRYDISASPQMLMLYFQLAVEPQALGNDDVRPTNTAPIIRVHEDKRVATMARWGLIPSWSKDAKIAQHTFNARGETVADKPSFRTAFKRRRCIVPASAFFEWKAVIGQKKKQKLRFNRVDGHLLALAGLWECWKRPETNELIESYTIITTTANDLMQAVHDRMPVILDPRDWAAWLDPEMNNLLLLQSMLQPCPDDWLACSPV